jgi:hypothetical protein
LIESLEKSGLFLCPFRKIQRFSKGLVELRNAEVGNKNKENANDHFGKSIVEALR